MKVIYVTGAPASGKSSTLRKLRDLDQSLYYFEYGAELTNHLQRKQIPIQNQRELRARSSDAANPEDIVDLDNELIELVKTRRENQNIIIDSHPVTKENFGFRITSFTEEKIKQLDPDEIWVFYTSPDVTIDRISKDPDGRPNISPEESQLHTILQSSIAATYGIISCSTVYLFDTNRDQEELVYVLLERLGK